MRKEENDSTNGGKKEALESVSPLPECNDHPEGGVPREELEEGEASQQDATVHELEKVNALMNAVLEAYQSIDGRVRFLVRVTEWAKNFLRKFFRKDILSDFPEEDTASPSSIRMAQDAQSALAFPPEKQVRFEDCWHFLYAYVRNAEKLDAFFTTLRACQTEKEIVQTIKLLKTEFPRLRESEILRHREGIEKLCTLLDNPFVAPQKVKDIKRKVEYKSKKAGKEKDISKNK
jgi:hypothetical protein